ncbi:MAG: hypothetical protein AB1813_22845 [Verrucomicrobiota bacterium]
MTTIFLVFWTLMIFASIAWYGFLLFYIGAKGGREIAALIRHLNERAAKDASGPRRST